jgi:DNA-directed RNA polymerase specialized sigma subunit
LGARGSRRHALRRILGLTLAGRAFDPGRGSFTAYAACRIEYSIRRGRQIRSGIPRSAWEKGDRGGPVSLNAAVRKDGPAIIDVLPGRLAFDADWLADALQRLPARDQVVLRLRYYHGLSQSEIAPVIARSQMQLSRIERGLSRSCATRSATSR